MIDFTLTQYRSFLIAIKSSFKSILPFDELFLSAAPDSFCVLRHDVDRKPYNALKMAQLEFELGIRATYYFRTKPHTFKPEILRAIHRLGHEIGYHYESLSDTKGNTEQALQEFQRDLKRLRRIVPVRTISMHGRPLSSFDNRDLWRTEERQILLRERFGILGEIYLNIDYRDIIYISDTGRNWKSNHSNLRDKVMSRHDCEFKNGLELLYFLKCASGSRIIFATHPERWSDTTLDYIRQVAMDAIVNFVKLFR